MRHTIVFGLGFGDEGKGSIVDALVRRQGFRTVVRFNGGPQAAHHVVLPDGRWHCFAQFCSGMLSPRTQSWLSEFMLVDPLALQKEELALRKLGVQNAFQRLYIDAACVVVTPFHKHLNRLQECLRDQTRHGSCGLGVGWAWPGRS